MWNSFGDHGGDAPKVSGTKCAAEVARKIRYIHKGASGLRDTSLRRWREDHVHLSRFAKVAICLQLLGYCS